MNIEYRKEKQELISAQAKNIYGEIQNIFAYKKFGLKKNTKK